MMEIVWEHFSLRFGNVLVYVVSIGYFAEFSNSDTYKPQS